MQVVMAPVCSPAQCCQLSGVRQRASPWRLRAGAFHSRPVAGRSAALSIRCAAATLEAPPAEAPSADDEGEIIVGAPPLRTNKKRSRRFKEMQSKVPAKTTALGEQTASSRLHRVAACQRDEQMRLGAALAAMQFTRHL